MATSSDNVANNSAAPTDPSAPVTNPAEQHMTLKTVDDLLKSREAEKARAKGDIRLLQVIKRSYRREINELSKAARKKQRKQPDGTSRRNAFAAEPLLLSEGSQMLWADLSKKMTYNIKEHKLQGREGRLKQDGTPNRQFITPNQELEGSHRRCGRLGLFQDATAFEGTPPKCRQVKPKYVTVCEGRVEKVYGLLGCTNPDCMKQGWTMRYWN